MKKSSKVFAAAAAGALALTAAATVTANAGPGSAATAVPAADIQPVPENVVQQNRISAGASAKAVSAALAKCQADKLPFVTVALVDRFGTVQAILRGDNAAEHTIEAAKQKAYIQRQPLEHPPANWPSGSTETAPASRTFPAPSSWPAASR
ncbi:hypothetical protein QF047_003610 [Arthrobacter sp. W4I7]|nr:hypothetical protein [Arthrobacter sp. W4I7]